MNKKNYDVNIWFEKETKLYVITAHKNGKQLVATQGRTFIEAFKMLGEAIQLREDYKDKTKSANVQEASPWRKH